MNEKRIPSNLESQFATLGANVLTFIDILMSMLGNFLVTLGQTTKMPQSFFSFDF
jgi:hypothetical protein